jgi:hypothetical protein
MFYTQNRELLTPGQQPGMPCFISQASHLLKLSSMPVSIMKSRNIFTGLLKAKEHSAIKISIIDNKFK